ncbi:hypothetical protein JMM63_21730 [Rhodovulum sulfidophilum]|uniref:hypothetical protein n=1 Tax=Rhodovulum sulfidophilum TaxID=35806 RepID=UPI001924894B|nr:hypothetical protein [Rhodovulum sulfidophilum]MBL3598129.1 hypothetical protein [Rhodovulum sulfidophilum]
MKNDHMATLHLPLRGVYFDQIKSGEKIEEYRLVTPFWAKRLEGRAYDRIELAKFSAPKGDTGRRITRPWRGFRKTTDLLPLETAFIGWLCSGFGPLSTFGDTPTG